MRQDAHLFHSGAVMQIYYPSLLAIHAQTMQLDNLPCPHCEQMHQLISHGFIYKKKGVGTELQAVGKRVFCSDRDHHAGCGRTVQLYLDSTVRYVHHASYRVVAFVLSLAAGMTIEHAYHHATGADTPRNAYRWLNRLCAQLSVYRSLSHRPPLQDGAQVVAAHRPVRLTSLTSTCKVLLQRFGQPLCAAYQSHTQRSFL